MLSIHKYAIILEWLREQEDEEEENVAEHLRRSHERNKNAVVRVVQSNHSYWHTTPGSGEERCFLTERGELCKRCSFRNTPSPFSLDDDEEEEETGDVEVKERLLAQQMQKLLDERPRSDGAIQRTKKFTAIR